MIKRLIIGLFLFAGFLMPIALSQPLAAAIDPIGDVCQQTPNAAACQASNQNPLYGPSGIITRAIQIIIIIIGVAAVITIIIAGMRYIISNGDSNSINSAKNAIIYAVIGLVVALLAQGIVSFVLTRIN